MKNIVLVVEDNAVNRRILIKILEDEYDIIEAENGKEAMEILQERFNEISAMILDLRMPVVSGKELLSILWKDKKYRNFPILVATGIHEQKEERQCLSMGAWDFIMKPYDPYIIRLRLCNIIERSQTQLMKQVQVLAQRDSLTRLYNRNYFMEETERLIRRYPEETFVLIRMDIDYFRLYNSSFGSKSGNKLLLQIAEKLRMNMADLHTDHLTYGRIESDVFCMCIPYRKEKLEQKLETTNQELMRIEETYRLKASYGLYVIEDHYKDMEEMYSYVVEASNKCKHHLNRIYAYYGKEMREQEEKALRFTNEMETAIRKKQFQVYLQPKYSMKTGGPCGAEALVRWKHPQWGMVSPGDFIPVFEQNGLIVELDYYMMENVCVLIAKWLKTGSVVYPVSVNLSRISMYNPKIVDEIDGLTEKYSVPKKLLNLEITESAYMSNPGMMKDIIDRFHSKGFVILMDDFGSGYSSLNTLKDIDVDILKIDTKFLPTGENNVKSEKILASIIRMAGWLGMPVVVEGVETRDQAAFLESIGCSCIQGYYYAKPMPVPEYEKLVSNHKVIKKEGENISRELLDRFDEIWSSESSIRTMLKSVAVPFAVLECGNSKVDVLRMNETFVKTYGNKPIEMLMSYKERGRLQNKIDEVVASKDSGECDCMCIMPDGKSQWQHVRLVYLVTIEKASLVSITLTDVTAQKMMEREINEMFSSFSDKGTGRRSLLIVDDQELSREILSNLFEEEYDIIQAENGEKALEQLKLHEEDIEAILLDMVMPEMDGGEFLAHKNKMASVEDIPVIIISSETDENLQINMLENGVNDYVTKPFIPALVRKRVRNVIEYNSRFRHLVHEYNEATE